MISCKCAESKVCKVFGCFCDCHVRSYGHPETDYLTGIEVERARILNQAKKYKSIPKNFINFIKSDKKHE